VREKGKIDCVGCIVSSSYLWFMSYAGMGRMW